MSAIYALSDRAVEELADANPVLATYVGVAGRDHRWPDLSPEGHVAIRDLMADLRAEAEATAVTGASETLAQQVLIDDLSREIEAHDDNAWRRDLNSISSTYQNLKGVFDLMAHDTLDEWSRLIVRLETIDRPLEGYRRCLAAGLDAGDVVARRQVETVVAEARVDGGDTSLFEQLTTALAESDIDDDGLADRLSRAVAGARQAILDFADWLEATYLPHAAEADGVGADRYVSEARRFLGMDIDPHETYAWGWSEIGRLWGRLGELCAELDPDADIATVIHDLRNDRERAAGSVDEFISLMQQRQETALAQLADVHFDVPEPIRTIAVKPSPPGGALAPYYTSPSEDFSRPGTVWYPLGSSTYFPLFEEVTTAHHEGFPGHHLQIGVQVARGEALSRYHRLVVWMPGSGEGWALYAEHLMGELGYLDPPEFEIGLLLAQLMRACRIVVDIGLHLELDIPDDVDFHPGARWSYDLAVEMMETRAFVKHEMAVSEVVRYLGWPGQAISYKLGEKVILDLRDQLVDHGDLTLKEFHTRVLDVGSVGLDLLKELVAA